MTQRDVRIFDLTFEESFRARFFDGCRQILDEGFLTNHTFVREFEAGLAMLCGVERALAVSSGTAAIEIPLRALNVKGREVVVSSNTFIATALAIENAGAHPVLVDLERDHYGMCPDALERAITPLTAAVVVVHIAGLITPYFERIETLCRRHGIPLVCDAAQAFGSTLNGRDVASLGTAAAFSFQTTKNMTTGEGGAVVTKDRSLHEKMKSIRQFGADFDDPGAYHGNGSNFRMSEFPALLGVCELERVRARIDKRRSLAARYQDRLRDSAWTCVVPAPNTQTGYYKQIVISPVPRARVDAHLKRHGVTPTGGVYFRPLHRQPAYRGRFDDASFPVSNAFADTHICPPCYPELEIADIDRIAELLLQLHS